MSTNHTPVVLWGLSYFFWRRLQATPAGGLVTAQLPSCASVRDPNQSQPMNRCHATGLPVRKRISRK
jgi:hypothetical protein